MRVFPDRLGHCPAHQVGQLGLSSPQATHHLGSDPGRRQRGAVADLQIQQQTVAADRDCDRPVPRGLDDPDPLDALPCLLVSLRPLLDPLLPLTEPLLRCAELAEHPHPHLDTTTDNTAPTVDPPEQTGLHS